MGREALRVLETEFPGKDPFFIYTENWLMKVSQNYKDALPSSPEQPTRARDPPPQALSSDFPSIGLSQSASHVMVESRS